MFLNHAAFMIPLLQGAAESTRVAPSSGEFGEDYLLTPANLL